MGDQVRELHKIFARWIRWYRLRRGLSWAVYGLAAGLGIAFLITAAGIWVYHYIDSSVGRESLPLQLAAGLLGTVIGLTLGILWPVSRLAAARQYDRALGLKERMTTALELSSLPAYQIKGRDELIGRQLEDTLTTAGPVIPWKGLTLRVRLAPLLLGVLFLAGLQAALYLGSDRMVENAAVNRAEEIAAEEIEEIAALIEAINASEELSDEQQAELTQPLQEAVESLENAQSLEEVVSILSQTEDELRELENSQADQMAEGLRNAGNSLSQQEGSLLQSAGQNMAEGDLLSAAQDLANLDLEELSAEELEALAEQLEAAAENLQASNPELAEQLSQAAESLQNGDISTAQQALSQAAQTLTASGQQIAQSQAAGEAAQQMAGAGERALQAGQSAQANAGSGEEGEGQGSGQGEGEGSGQGQGEGEGGSGAGRGEGGDESAQGSEAGSDPIEQGNGPGDGGERAYEQIFVPEHLGGSEGDDLGLGNSGEPGDQVTGQGNASPGSDTGSSVPYDQVFRQYAESARRAADNPNIPPAFRSLIRMYFSSLEP